MNSGRICPSATVPSTGFSYPHFKKIVNASSTECADAILNHLKAITGPLRPIGAILQDELITLGEVACCLIGQDHHIVTRWECEGGPAQ